MGHNIQGHTECEVRPANPCQPVYVARQLAVGARCNSDGLKGCVKKAGRRPKSLSKCPAHRSQSGPLHRTCLALRVLQPVAFLFSMGDFEACDPPLTHFSFVPTTTLHCGPLAPPFSPFPSPSHKAWHALGACPLLNLCVNSSALGGAGARRERCTRGGERGTRAA